MCIRDSPGTHAGPRKARVSAIHQQQRRLVIRNVRVHRSDYRDVIDVLRDMGEQLTHFDTALTVRTKLEWGLKSSPGAAFRRQIVRRQGLAVQTRERGFGIKRIHMRRPPIGKYMNCLLYTSDAADERSSVDLGGR